MSISPRLMLSQEPSAKRADTSNCFRRIHKRHPVVWKSFWQLLRTYVVHDVCPMVQLQAHTCGYCGTKEISSQPSLSRKSIGWLHAPLHHTISLHDAHAGFSVLLLGPSAKAGSLNDPLACVSEMTLSHDPRFRNTEERVCSLDLSLDTATIYTSAA